MQHVKEFLRDRKLPWEHALLGEWSSTDVPKRFAVSSVPTYVLVGPDGRIVAHEGSLDAIAAILDKAATWIDESIGNIFRWAAHDRGGDQVVVPAFLYCHRRIAAPTRAKAMAASTARAWRPKGFEASIDFRRGWPNSPESTFPRDTPATLPQRSMIGQSLYSLSAAQSCVDQRNGDAVVSGY